MVRSSLGTVVGLITISLLATACGSSSSSANSPSAPKSASTATSAAAAVKAADSELATVEKGVFTHPPTSPSPGAKGKNIWVIESYAGSPSIAVPAQAVKAADSALGWKTTVYNADGLPSNYVVGVNDAIANGANGIVLDAIDCSYVEGPLKAAAAKHIAVSAIYAFDCNRTTPGGPRLFSANISFGRRFSSEVALWHLWGSSSAAYVISATGGHAHTLLLATNQYSVLKFYDQGFTARMAQCGTCKVDAVPWNAFKELTPTAIEGLITSAAVAHPHMNSAVFGSTVTTGFDQGILALGSRVKTMKVIGGLGLPAEIALLRQHKGLTATTAWPQQWIGWAAVDSINSVLSGRPRQDEGIGFQVLDSSNVKDWPAPGEFWTGVPDYAKMYEKRWGV